ncbi:ATP-grasp domain-containing protein [Jatrophihabitans sp.]|uniref:ATP-grasp domain-containing protein n=1 Tax=Jatrophihabitans sp. TaxID=1932789 RepID=UPI002C9C5309|nr:ATP-grasp domain-containing protein [Jatrophihabitans sp.]
MTTPTPEQRPALLVIGTGLRSYREYLLRSISSQFRIHLFHTAEPSWEKDYIAGWTVLPSTSDGPAMAETARTLHQQQPFDGVLCWDEARIHATSFVAQALGVRNGDPDVIARLRDKGQTRAALAVAGVPQPRSVPVKDEAEALAAAAEVGYPAILKPRGLGASLGVVRVENAQELRRMFPFTRDTRAPEPVALPERPVLVEECVLGEEISIDSVISDGRVTPLFIGRKVLGYPPYAEEVGHYVSADDPLLTDATLLAALQDTHAALGFTDGWTHSEYMLTSTGPQVIEVNGRLGGDLIPYLGLLATGIDPGLTAARAACGLPLELTASQHRTAAIRFFYVAEENTEITSVSFEGAQLPEEVHRTIVVAAPGAVVSPPPKGTAFGRIAAAIAAADSIPRCAAALDAAEAALVITGTVQPSTVAARP